MREGNTNQPYPTIILGEDTFTGWFPKCKTVYKSEDERAIAYHKVLEIAFELGVRGFSISPHQTLLKVLKEFKSKHPEIICIANPHFHSHYYFDGKSAWDKNNFDLLQNLVNDSISKPNDNSIKLRINQIKDQISLNVDEYQKQLHDFSDFCDYSIVGNFGGSILQLLGRMDIINKEIEIIRKLNMSPIGICEKGGICLELMKNMDVERFWVKTNRDLQQPNSEKLKQFVQECTRPITAYKIFSLKDGFAPDKDLEFLHSLGNVDSIVVGVDNADQARETFAKLFKIWNH